MSIGSLGGIVSSAAGAPMQQTSSSEAERTRESAVQQRGQDTAERAERAAGIGTTDQDQETSERDADGRRLWEETAKKKDAKQEEAKAAEAAAVEARQSKDATGQSGTHLDLTG
jgi:hypothetical protein